MGPIRFAYTISEKIALAANKTLLFGEIGHLSATIFPYLNLKGYKYEI